jgi:FtsP/CotA-like multicopper oxidase with cupredoxin domain
MAKKPAVSVCLLLVLICAGAFSASAQSFRVQCPTSTITHPLTGTNCITNPTNSGCNNTEPAYNGPTQFNAAQIGVPAGTTGDFVTPIAGTVNGAIKCQQISGGDGLMTEADGTQTFMFAFGPLSGLADIAAGGAGTEPPYVFNTVYPTGCPTCNGLLSRGDPAPTDGATTGASPWMANPALSPVFTYNGAIGLNPSIPNIVTITDILEGTPPLATNTTPPPANLPLGADYCSSTPGTAGYPGPNVVTVYMNAPLGVKVGDQVVIANDATQTGVGGVPTASGYLGTKTVTCVNINGKDPIGQNSFLITYDDPIPNLPSNTGNNDAGTAAILGGLDGHVDPRQIMDVGVMNGNLPMPLAAFDEDDEFFLTLTNVGMIMRPDLFEQHTVHFHGYPNASSFYDGVPDASIAINIGASFTYYYLAPDAGTYFYHCHITPPEHLQMGMVGQLHVRPRQDRVPIGNGANSLFTFLGYQNGIGLPAGTKADLRTVCNPAADILCSATMPAINTSAVQGLDKLGNQQRYTYNDGDGSTAYDVEYPLQMHGFDPNFHFVGMTFNPEMFVDMKDKYFLLNGRSYPDTVGLCGGAAAIGAATPCAPGPQATVTTEGAMHYSQPMPALINIPVGGRALLRLVNLSVSEYHTLASLGIPMKEVGFMAKLLRDQAGLNTEFYTNSITLGGGESLDVILDASDATCNYDGAHTGCGAALYPAGSVFYLYTPQLDHLSNDAENFGGLMTEVHICNSVTGGNTFGNVCN